MCRRCVQITVAAISITAVVVTALASPAMAEQEYRLVSKPVVAKTRVGEGAPRFFVFARFDRSLPAAADGAVQAAANVAGTGFTRPGSSERGWGALRLGRKGAGCYYQSFDVLPSQTLWHVKLDQVVTLKFVIRDGTVPTRRVRVERVRGPKSLRAEGNADYYARRLGCNR